jgi:hypothetical protein
MKTLEQAVKEKANACGAWQAAKYLYETDPEVIEARRVCEEVVARR